MNSDSSILKTLSKTEMVRDYERAFGDATGLPVAIVSKDDWRPALRGKRHENPFCALISGCSKTCAACLQCQSSLRQNAQDKPRIKVCPYGLAEAAVPIRVGAETAGFLITGQVMREKPSEAQFEAISKKLDPSIDRKEAHDAYFSTPVVPKRMLESSVHLLSLFAEHLAIKGNQMAVQTSNTEPSVVTKARNYLNEHMEEDVTLGQVARAAGASTFYLCKLFRKHLGMTFTEYLSRCRVERAKEMLLKPTARVSEVAFEAGFQSLTHFNRVFRKVVGGSPTEYRDQLPAMA